QTESKKPLLSAVSALSSSASGETPNRTARFGRLIPKRTGWVAVAAIPDSFHEIAYPRAFPRVCFRGRQGVKASRVPKAVTFHCHPAGEAAGSHARYPVNVRSWMVSMRSLAAGCGSEGQPTAASG